MRNDWLARRAAFEFENVFTGAGTGFRELEALDAEAPLASQPGPTRRTTEANTRWLQSALNRVLGLRLAVDGIAGPQTRSAIRSLQRRRGLTIDGVAGPRTIAALHALGPHQVAPPVLGGACPVPQHAEIAWERQNPAGRISTASEGELMVLILSNFAVGSAALKPEHERQLRRISLRGRVGDMLIVEGHSSCSGTSARKQRIAQLRAEAVGDFLRRHGVAQSQMDIFGSSDSRPRVPNTTAENMSHNRRVELHGGIVT
jgi:outer membrane protein OmpA-like peptidoglycan-associated protein